MAIVRTFAEGPVYFRCIPVKLLVQIVQIALILFCIGKIIHNPYEKVQVLIDVVMLAVSIIWFFGYFCNDRFTMISHLAVSIVYFLIVPGFQILMELFKIISKACKEDEQVVFSDFTNLAFFFSMGFLLLIYILMCKALINAVHKEVLLLPSVAEERPHFFETKKINLIYPRI